ncbi:CK1 family protein kinase [Tritrichomonas foetus]|uniref:non-specific serine/threonine protein kinase n=1 Tax=Tritrichomonas foetus TaxID=1144522 RepID=A0A1J4KRM6_9EUKA|nr:CK1 family protein kinase [Tritrichomonas foetus]|eukprot:OHT13907.1 CK1 family protein kinase [Tritrichomonas foetus]
MSASYSYSSSYTHEEIPAGTKIGEFEVIQMIGEGGYGQIYEVVKDIENKHYAMKIEYLSARKKGLQLEVRVLKDCQISSQFPLFVDSGRTSTFRFFVMELLGPSLSQLCRSLSTRTFSKYTYLHLSIHMVRCIQSLHRLGYIHRDVKPGNFLIRPYRKHPLCFIDFGLARKYITETGEVKPPRKNPGYTGTMRYASLTAHDEKELSRRDDLISWFYSMIELSAGALPWPGSENKEKTIKMKRTMEIEDLCKSLTPEFVDIYKMITALKYEDEPDYDGIVNLIKKSIVNQSFIVHKYDWELMNRHEIIQISTIPLDMHDLASSDPALNKNEHEGGCCIIS